MPKKVTVILAKIATEKPVAVKRVADVGFVKSALERLWITYPNALRQPLHVEQEALFVGARIDEFAERLAQAQDR